MTDENAFLVDAFRRLIAETVTPDRVRDVEKSLSAGPLWDDLKASGFLDALVPEAQAGAGLSLAQAFPLISIIGEHAVPLPFAETMIARGIFAMRGSKVPDDAVVALAPASQVIPFGNIATHAVVQRTDKIELIEISADRSDIFGTGSALTISEGRSIGAVDAEAGFLLLAAAAVTSAQMAGAMARILEMTLRYAADRQQFGRPLGKFQAIQQQLAVLAERVIASQVAARTAFSTDQFDGARVAAAKCLASEAATHVSAIAHAVHGAIGATAEFDLQLYTRRLKQGQLAFGSESYWGEQLGRLRLAAGHRTTADFLRLQLADQGK